MKVSKIIILWGSCLFFSNLITHFIYYLFLIMTTIGFDRVFTYIISVFIDSFMLFSILFIISIIPLLFSISLFNKHLYARLFLYSVLVLALFTLSYLMTEGKMEYFLIACISYSWTLYKLWDKKFVAYFDKH